MARMLTSYPNARATGYIVADAQTDEVVAELAFYTDDLTDLQRSHVAGAVLHAIATSLGSSTVICGVGE